MDITGAARSVIMIGKANDHSEEVYLAHVKSNLAPKGPTLVFTIEDKRAFCEGTTEFSADQLLGCEDVPAYQQTKSGTVEDALLGVFSDVDEVLSQQVYDFFGGNGISKRTVNAVKKRLSDVNVFNAGKKRDEAVRVLGRLMPDLYKLQAQSRLIDEQAKALREAIKQKDALLEEQDTELFALGCKVDALQVEKDKAVAAIEMLPPDLRCKLEQQSNRYRKER